MSTNEQEEMQPPRPQHQPRRNRNMIPNPGRWPYRDATEDEKIEDFQPDLSKMVLSKRFAVRVGYNGPSQQGMRRIARQISEDMPDIVKMAHDSGDAEVIFHCPFCGSGQVVARNDGTVECEFCQACFTVQVQPQYPAFPQTINGVPVNVPGMGPQFPGMEPPPGAPGMAVPGPDDQDADGVPDEGEAEDPAEGDDGGNPFAKSSSMLYRTASGAWLNEDQYVRHLALATTHKREALIQTMREENRWR